MTATRTLLQGVMLALAAGLAHASANTPYAGQERRAIKALSEAEVADLLAGKGMGLAKSAELNGYPGPAHVLELAEALSLTDAQRAATADIHRRMDAAAKAAGAQLVQAERELDTLFRERTVTPETLRAALQEVARRQALVREAHLQAHLEQTHLLTAQQIARYNELRGYAGGHGESKGHGHGRHRDHGHGAGAGQHGHRH